MYRSPITGLGGGCAALGVEIKTGSFAVPPGPRPISVAYLEGGEIFRLFRECTDVWGRLQACMTVSGKYECVNE